MAASTHIVTDLTTLATTVWTAIDVSAIDFFAPTGELTLPLNIVGLWFSEVDIVYTAGLNPIPDTVKFACAQIAKNMMATGGINIKASQIDKLAMQYFGDTLIDQTVQQMLAPYVAQKVG